MLKSTTGKKTVVRFNLRWFLDIDGHEYGDEMEGCLATVTKDAANVVWTPHSIPSYGGGHKMYCPHNITPDLHQLVTEKLLESGAMDRALVEREKFRDRNNEFLNEEFGGLVWKEESENDTE
jgi:hypothetical protein